MDFSALCVGRTPIGLAVLATLASQRTTSRLADGGALE